MHSNYKLVIYNIRDTELGCKESSFTGLIRLRIATASNLHATKRNYIE